MSSADLIRRQDAINALWEDIEDCFVLHDAIKSIQRVPSAEIIRCKDCKYASPNGKYGCKAYHFKQYEVHEMYADDFCSKGERRTDE